LTQAITVYADPELPSFSVKVLAKGECPAINGSDLQDFASPKASQSSSEQSANLLTSASVQTAFLKYLRYLT